jgi:hypothetical protein
LIAPVLLTEKAERALVVEMEKIVSVSVFSRKIVPEGLG